MHVMLYAHVYQACWNKDHGLNSRLVIPRSIAVTSTVKWDNVNTRQNRSPKSIKLYSYYG